MGNVIDMRRFGGLRYALPVTHWTFLCGAAALAGVPLLSGFWSKDEILAVALLASGGEHSYRGLYVACFLAGLVTAGLTAFYTFRAYFLTFWGELRTPPEAGEHVHESPPVMTVPLRVLAVGAVGLGIVLEPFTHWLSHLIEGRFMLGLLPQPAEHGHNWALMLGSSVFALGGVGAAWFMYVRQPGFADRLAQGVSALYQLSLNKFHVDELYYALLVQPLNGLAEFSRIFDQYVVDGLVDLVGHIPGLVGRLLRPIQNGLVQFYALAMMLGLTVFLGALVVRMVR